jgi:ribose transport system ATP-binding protein
MTAPVLEIRGVSKSFPGVRALDDVSFAINRGEVVGLIGENGAGKSTLLKVLNGVYRPDAGSICVDGRAVAIASPRQAFDSGIAMVFQEQSVLPTLTVAENIFLGREDEFIRFGLISRKRMNEAAAKELAKVHLTVDPATRCADLSFADRQMVEIAKALSLDGRIRGHVTILLDEPTSVLDKREVDLLFQIVRDLKQRASFVFISHRLEEVLEISDRVYVLRDGRCVKELPAAGATVRDLHGLMVGRQLHHEYYRETRQAIPASEVVLAAEGLSRGGAFRNVSFELHAGEVLGFAGLIGARRTDVGLALIGIEPADSGEIIFDGRPVQIKTPEHAMQLGIAYVTEDRRGLGLTLPMSIATNITLPTLRRYLIGLGLIRRGDEQRTA